MALSYEDAGVDKHEGYRAVEKMKADVAATQGAEVIGGLGSFASLYALGSWNDPVLVSGTDGVGTKLRLALDAGRLDLIGRDCYAMVANDILCHGARPLFFLDYMACGKLDADTAAGIVAGMAAACREDECALVGGETAEMPGFYAPGDYDVAGFIVGAVEKDKLVDGSKVEKGDLIIGLASNGIHSNGYSLVRALFPDSSRHPEAFLEATRLYGRPVRHVIEDGAAVKGMAHITGGGLPENLPRAFAGKPLDAEIRSGSWIEPEVFSTIRDAGVKEEDMRGTFNLGVGFTLIVDPSDAAGMLAEFKELGEEAWVIGEMGSGSGRLCYV